ncbi:MAG: hypothetical protein CME17_02250 [Gemmatimonadetes bacterium]|nr:hypothetical protein [Gemmatimonadota bacterium]|tara:strand:+ start:1379 stop:1780 length:402 start_codon:yes stop_codon:yes gene_type:complete
MKIRNLSMTLLLSAAIVSPGVAQDLTGTWEISTQGGRGGPQTSMLVLVQDGETLTGTMKFSLGGPGGRGGGAQELEVANGTVEDNSFSFTVTLSVQGNSFDLNYSGTVDGDEMSGTRGGPRGGGQPFTGQKQG